MRYRPSGFSVRRFLSLGDDDGFAALPRPPRCAGRSGRARRAPSGWGRAEAADTKLLSLLKRPPHRVRRRATAISLNGPHPSPMAITLSAAVTMTTLRAWPIPVGSEMVRWGLAWWRSMSGRIPMTVPPACEAPSLAAADTPPNPPLMMTAPASARSLPTSRAESSWAAVASEAPHTATYLRGIDREVYSVDFVAKFNARGAKRS